MSYRYAEPKPLDEAALLHAHIIPLPDGTRDNALSVGDDVADLANIVGIAFNDANIHPALINLLRAAPFLFQQLKSVQTLLLHLETLAQSVGNVQLESMCRDHGEACQMALETAVSGLDTVRNKIQAENATKHVDGSPT